MLTISDVEKALKKCFKVEAFKDRLEIHEFQEPSSVLVTLDNENVVVTCEIAGQPFINKIPFEEFKYCMKTDNREIYMLRMLCRKCTHFMYCASSKKSLSECMGNVFTP